MQLLITPLFHCTSCGARSCVSSLIYKLFKIPTLKTFKMKDQDKFKINVLKRIDFLEAKIERLENENRDLKSALHKQVDFGNRMTELIAEMDFLLGKKKLEIESLTNQLLCSSPDARSEADSNIVVDSFCLDLETPAQKMGFLELQKTRNQRKENYEKTVDGKFKCPYEDICDFVSAYQGNIKVHIRRHTNEKPFVCDICGREFKQRSACKNHMMTHPEMNAVKCKYCGRKISADNIENHMEKCSRRKSRKRKRSEAGSQRDDCASPQ